MAFHANRSPDHLDVIARINAIPVKKHPMPQMTFLTGAEAQALLDAITTDSWTGRRDRAMFTLAIQTGLRLSEITSRQAPDLHLGAGAHVACTGKGRKNRTTPLTVATTTVLKAYLHERNSPSRPCAVPRPPRPRTVCRRRPAAPERARDPRADPVLQPLFSRVRFRYMSVAPVCRAPVRLIVSRTQPPPPGFLDQRSGRL